jgi:Nif11 domain
VAEMRNQLKPFLDTILANNDMQQQIIRSSDLDSFNSIARANGFEIKLSQRILKNWARFKAQQEDDYFNPGHDEDSNERDLRLYLELKAFLSDVQLGKFLELLKSDGNLQGDIENASDIGDVINLAAKAGFEILPQMRFLRRWLRSLTEEAEGMYWGEVSDLDEEEIDPWLQSLRDIVGD